MRRILLLPSFIFAIIFAVGFCAAAVPAMSATANQETPPLKIRVDVRAITLEVVALNKKGGLETNLNLENFRVKVCADNRAPLNKKNKGKDKEDCIVQRIEFFEKHNLPPLRLKILIDTSGSTANYLEKFSKKAVLGLIQTVMTKKSEDRFSIWEFYDGPHQIVEWGNNIDAAKNALVPLKANGQSGIFNSIYLAAKEMASIKTKGEPITKIIFVFTDGIDNIRFPLIDEKTGEICPEEKRDWRKSVGCRRLEKDDLIYALQEARTVLYAVDFSKKYNPVQTPNTRLNAPEDLEDVALSSGGQRFLVDSTHGAQKAFEQVAEFIGKNYIIGFYPTPADPRWYSVSIEIGEMKNGEWKVDKYLTEHSYYRKRYQIK